jgi:hypothetical protein
MLFAVLGFGAIVLTCAMFQSRQAMLGFPCLIFWAIMGGYCYQQSTATWDIYYLTFFGSFGMAIFCAFAAYGLRTKKEEMADGDDFIDEGKDDVKFIDEGGKSDTEDGEEKPRRISRSIRERADKRRARWD